VSRARGVSRHMSITNSTRTNPQNPSFDARPDNHGDGDFYFLSNDEIRVNFKKSLKNRHNVTAVGVANPHFLHVLAEASFCLTEPIEITAIDLNPSQLRHFRNLVTAVLQSETRLDFLSRLFTTRFGPRAVKEIAKVRPQKRGFVRGGTTRDRLYHTECRIWKDASFSADDFCTSHKIRNPQMTRRGIRIEAKTIGDINTYYATLVCGSRKAYDHWPFTAALGCGFLRSETDFLSFRNWLGACKIHPLQADISEVLEDLLMAFRYRTIVFWASNVFIDYFVDKNPKLASAFESLVRLGTNHEPDHPELDLVFVQDMRDPTEIPREIDARKRRRRDLSIHSKTFSIVEKHLVGSNNVEIINMPVWFEKDQGISKLPGTAYLMADDFLESSIPRSFDTIFVHILVGHGMPRDRYERLLNKAMSCGRRILVLEHNRESRDFRRSRIGLTVDDIREILGREQWFEYCPGKKISDRNLLFIYER